MRNIALIGKARAGKDSAAAHLVDSYAYTRLAFADPLKEFALRVNPIINAYAVHSPSEAVTERLADIVRERGWERAKDEVPEVRRFLQAFGQGQRDNDPDYWLDMLLRKVDGAASLNMPVVVTDVRYRNEALALRKWGFRLVRITRGVPDLGAASAHPSETELDDYPVDVELVNGGSLDALHALIASQI